MSAGQRERPPATEGRAAGAHVVGACDFLVKYTGGLLGGLRELGADTSLVCRDHAHEFGGDVAARQAFLRRGPLAGARRFEIPGRPRDPLTWADAVRVRRAVTAWGPDVVHLQHTVLNDPRLILAAGARPNAYALTLHDVEIHPGDAQIGGLKERILDELVRRAALVFVHADALVERLERRTHAPVPIEVVPHGVDAPTPLPLPARPALLFFGRLSRYKGLDVLLDAMPVVWERAPDVALEIAGEGTVPEHPALADPRVRLRHEHVPEEELEETFARASVVVLPYREASQSGVGSLAKRFGRPIVATRTGGLPELVADGSGVLVDPEDPVALADAVVELATQPDLAARLVAAAADDVALRSGWPRVAELTLEAYRRHGLLGAGTPRAGGRA